MYNRYRKEGKMVTKRFVERLGFSYFIVENITGLLYSQRYCI